jgi:hypothetical protein
MAKVKACRLLELVHKAAVLYVEVDDLMLAHDEG